MYGELRVLYYLFARSKRLGCRFLSFYLFACETQCMIQSAMFCYLYIITEYSTSTPCVYIYTCMLIFNARRFLLSWANFNASMGFKPTENIRANITSYPIQYSFNCMHCDYDHGCWSAQVSEFSVRALQLFNLMIIYLILYPAELEDIISKFMISVALTHTVPVLCRVTHERKMPFPEKQEKHA